MRLPDYHIHTELCGHATGAVDEYIEAAIGASLGEIGFSDHAPLPEELREGITMPPEKTEPYIAMVQDAAGRYRDRIEVRTGFEVDFPLHPTFDSSYFSDPRLDFLTGSCHFIDGWPFDHPEFMKEFDRRDIDETYRRYFAILKDLVSSGLFNIIGHLDLVKKFGHRPTEDFTGAIEAIFSNCPHRDMAVEINTAGLRKPVGEMYPSRDIIDTLFRLNVPVTLGSDAHCPGEVGHEFGSAVELIRRAGYRKISGFKKRKRFDIQL
jgi:histidinol-phosphatase (PHP family)